MIAMYYENYRADDILQYAIDVLEHYGTKHHSGRYPWGSGEDPYQHEEGYPFKTSGDFLARVEEYEKKGMTEKQIADELGTSVKKYRVYKSVANAERRAALARECWVLHNDGINNSEIGRRLGLGESQVRNLLKSNETAKRKAMQGTIDFLKKEIEDKGMVAIGEGDEYFIGTGISRSMMDNAMIELEAEGYEKYPRRVRQPTNKEQYTTIQVLCKPGTPYSDVYNNEDINYLFDFASDDGGETFRKMKYPASMDSSRLQIRYAEDGGKEKDGVMEIRRGVKDLYMGDGVHYCQTRILVDGTHYLKGMAVYSDDLPDGVDIVFNTNKTKDIPALGPKDHSVLKPIKKDPNNPFGSYISAKGQSEYDGEDGEKHLSLINKRQNEGEWAGWDSTSLPSQFLAKQKSELIQKQLDLSIADKKAEYEEIMSLTNPSVKRHLLYEFASDCDATAVELSAAALPRQQYHVILPLTSIKDNEVYAPQYEDGSTVALVRFPHEGTYQIPILTVNNKNREGRKVISPEAPDAVGISSAVAETLSGADFDGDTVMVIPTTKGRNGITARPPLKDLEGYDAKLEYPALYDENGKQISKRMTKSYTQNQMGDVSNLIMDMTLKGASDEELARATKYAQCVIDAEKHNLNYQACYKEQGIAELKKTWKTSIDPVTGKESHGASTLLTRAGSEVHVDKRKGSERVAEDGTLYWNTAPDSERFWTDEKGKTHERTSVTTQMALEKDAHNLSSGTKKEEQYADYANTLKAMANTARKEWLATKKTPYNKEAAEKYSVEVESLKNKLEDAIKNKPRERAAEIRAEAEINARIDAIKEANPEISKKEIKKERSKIAQDVIEVWRNKTGAHRTNIDINDREWEAVQSGALHPTTFEEILKYADESQLRQRSMPKKSTELSNAQKNRIKALSNSGYTTEQIAKAVGCSVTSVNKYKKSE